MVMHENNHDELCCCFSFIVSVLIGYSMFRHTTALCDVMYLVKLSHPCSTLSQITISSSINCKIELQLEYQQAL